MGEISLFFLWLYETKQRGDYNQDGLLLARYSRVEGYKQGIIGDLKYEKEEGKIGLYIRKALKNNYTEEGGKRYGTL